jgi:hypothetical protein
MCACQVSITKSTLAVGLKGAEAVLDGELYASVKPEECYWNIADGRILDLTLQKVRTGMTIKLFCIVSILCTSCYPQACLLPALNRQLG